METSAKTGDNIDKVVLKNNKKTISIQKNLGIQYGGIISHQKN